MSVQDDEEGLKSCRTHQHLIYADDVIIVGATLIPLRKHRISIRRKKVSLEMNVKETEF
jgi:hypothetical protein